MRHVVIIGNGVAGITAARSIRKLSDYRITVISGESAYFFSRTALMYVYMGQMTFEHLRPYENGFWQENRINLLQAWVSSVDFGKKEVILEEGEPVPYDRLILATGSNYATAGWPGQDLEGVQGLYHLQDLEKMEETTRRAKQAVIVGGGLIGVEMAEMLATRGIGVKFLVREQHYWDIVLTEKESCLIERHIRSKDVDLRLGTGLKEIESDGAGRVAAVVTTEGERMTCDFVGLTIGVSPNVRFLDPGTIEIQRGILVDEYLRTSVPDVFAIGDCAELRHPATGRRSLEPVWYTGRMMGETVAKTVCGDTTRYEQGIWFNSAKFFDIEYQTYGRVDPTPREGEVHFFWESADGKHSVTIAYEEKSMVVLGMNALGIRMRQEVWINWIENMNKLEAVVAALHQACFDPEFYRPFDMAIQQKFNTEFPWMKVPVRKQTFWERLLS